MNWWGLVVVVPFISLVVERLLELFDALITLNLFPWWRRPPPLPPTMFLPDPVVEANRGNNDKSKRTQENKGDNDKSKRTEGNNKPRQDPERITYPVGSMKLDLVMETHDEALQYYTREKRFHYLKLEHYIYKYGHFLFRSSSLIRWNSLEQLLANREGVSQRPFNGRDLSQLTTLGLGMQGVDQPPSDLVLTQLELLSQYCYLRSQRTHEAFSVLKRQVYSVLGLIFGLAAAWFIQASGLVLSQAIGAGGSDTAGSLNLFARMVFQENGPALTWVTGLAGGLGSQPMHGAVNAALNLPRQGPAQPEIDYFLN